MVSDEAYTLLVDVKEQTRASMSTLIDQAVTMTYGTQGIPDIDDPTLSEDFITSYGDPGQDDTGMEPEAIEDAVNATGGPVESIEQNHADDQGEQDQAGDGDTATDEPDPKPQGEQIPDCTGETITIEERDNILMQVERLLPGKENIQARVDLLNEKSVPVIVKAGKYGGAWDKKKFSNNLRLAKKRLGDQAPVTDDTTTAAQDPVESIGADDTALGDQGKTDDELLRERDLKLVELTEQYPGRDNVQKRVDVLNASGITLKGVAGEWTQKKFTDNLRFAKKRLGIK